jgi:hypothetical protein
MRASWYALAVIRSFVEVYPLAFANKSALGFGFCSAGFKGGPFGAVALFSQLASVGDNTCRLLLLTAASPAPSVFYANTFVG